MKVERSSIGNRFVQDFIPKVGQVTNYEVLLIIFRSFFGQGIEKIKVSMDCFMGCLYHSS